MSAIRRAFTLVEILIVVVILGILASIVVPKFSNAVQESSETATLDQLDKVRRALSVYYVQNGSAFPAITEGDGTWAELLTSHMRTPPVNAWVRPENSKKIVIGDRADDAWQGDYAWIYDPATGQVYAGGFSAQDQPFPRE
ncbi:MAG: prepilin-type N-terminal cleavage/methylation domain-containing protein [Phycisphaerae bacterium]|nr:prepilin-type N-terminal cleavage/methylation domain-containing protein [Phycisphaerae bacterium]